MNTQDKLAEAAQAQAQAQSGEWVVVPKEPTERMLQAAEDAVNATMHCESTTDDLSAIAYKAALAAAPQQAAVPVAWRTFDGEGNYDYRDYENNEHYRDWYVSRNGAKYANWVEPLYSHPAPSDAERLAEAVHNCIRDLRIAAEYGKTMRNPKALLETVESAEAALATHSAMAKESGR